MTQTPDFERRIYEALAEEAAATGWNQADAYLKRHAADHAAASGQLDDLISQQDFLSNTDPSTLAPHLRRPLDSRAGQLGAVFRAGIDLHREATDHRARAQRLLIDHSRAGFSEPANVGDAASLWRPAWCIGSQLHPAQLDVLQRSDNVRAVAFGQVAGRPVAITSSEDQTVRVWDLDTGEQRSVMTGHTREVSAVAFGQAAGHPVAITGSGDRTVRVWDLDTGEQRSVMTGHTRPVHAVAFGQAAGHPVAITGSGDRTVRVWDLDTGSERSVMTGHTRPVHAVAFGQAAGHPVAITGSQDRTVRMWDLDTGSERSVITSHTSPVTAVAFGQVVGHPVAITGSQDRTVRVWDLDTETEVDRLNLPASVTALALAPPTQLLVAYGQELMLLEPPQKPWSHL